MHLKLTDIEALLRGELLQTEITYKQLLSSLIREFDRGLKKEKEAQSKIRNKMKGKILSDD